MKLEYLPKSLKIHWFFKTIFTLTALFLIWVIFFYGVPKIIPPQRIESQEVYGLIFANQIWGGDIIITGDVFSPTNSTITVLPGTKIKVAINNDKSNLDFLPWHQKSGVNTGASSKGVKTGEPFWDEREKIQIHLNDVDITGEPSNPVEITSDSEHTSPYDFNLLKIKSGKISHTVFSGYRRFEVTGDLVLINSIFRSTGECSLCIRNGQPIINNNIFESSLRESVWVQRASPKIHNNLFINLTGDGIKVDPKKIGTPVITHNSFEMPQKTAINIISGNRIGEILIEKNIFSGNSLIEIACDANTKIRDNVILGSVSFSNGCNSNFTFGPNFWGTNDPKSVMSEKILNKYDKFDILIPNILLSPPKESGRK